LPFAMLFIPYLDYCWGLGVRGQVLLV
jgi:hypothetical protein